MAKRNEDTVEALRKNFNKIRPQFMVYMADHSYAEGSNFFDLSPSVLSRLFTKTGLSPNSTTTRKIKQALNGSAARSEVTTLKVGPCVLVFNTESKTLLIEAPGYDVSFK